MALAELTMVMTQDEASKRYCPISMADNKSRCEASGCHAWRWRSRTGEPQHDARIATGYCGMPHAPALQGVLAAELTGCRAQQFRNR
jgi:hypothetical protein